MNARITTAVLAALLFAGIAWAGQEAPRNMWPHQYKERSAESMAQQFEEPSRAVFRYRAAMAGLMRLKPGMHVAEIGAGSGFFARTLAEQVGPAGRVYATELEDKMVAYMREAAARAGLSNVTAVKGEVQSTGLADGSVDAAALITTYSYLDRPDDILRSLARAVRPGGLLLVVDLPQTGTGAEASGVEADGVIAAAKAAGFSLVDESSVVPGHYALRFTRS